MSVIEIIKGQAARPDQIIMVVVFVTFILSEMIVSSYRNTKLYSTQDIPLLYVISEYAYKENPSVQNKNIVTNLQEKMNSEEE